MLTAIVIFLISNRVKKLIKKVLHTNLQTQNSTLHTLFNLFPIEVLTKHCGAYIAAHFEECGAVELYDHIIGFARHGVIYRAPTPTVIVLVSEVANQYYVVGTHLAQLGIGVENVVQWLACGIVGLLEPYYFGLIAVAHFVELHFGNGTRLCADSFIYSEYFVSRRLCGTA
jgi:hypothetical protein